MPNKHTNSVNAILFIQEFNNAIFTTLIFLRCFMDLRKLSSFCFNNGWFFNRFDNYELFYYEISFFEIKKTR